MGGLQACGASAALASSPFGALASPVAWGQPATPSAQMKWGSQATPSARGSQSTSYALPPVPRKEHKEVQLEPVARAAFESRAFERFKIPEVEPPPSVC